MEKIKWCFRQKKGIKIIEPSLTIAKAYLSDAKRDFSLIDRNEPKWNIIKEYYACYNALYSLFVKCGIKCEIHDCTIGLMSFFDFSDELQDKMIELKKERMDVQYYLENSDKDYYGFVKEFLDFCEIKFLNLNDKIISEIRKKLREIEND